MHYESGKRKSAYLWIIVLVTIILILNAPPVRKFKPLRTARVFANNVIFPFKYAGSAAYDAATSGIRNFVRIKGIQRENEQLKKEISEYRARNMLLNELDRENSNLRKMLAFKTGYFGYKIMPAQIIGRSASNWFETIEINRGLSDNVSVNTAVINGEGLVGRVFEVSQFSSKVLLVTDPSSAVSVLDAATGDMGILAGNSIGPLTIKYISSNADIKVGDRMVTSGMSDIFPKGIFVGSVRSVSKKDYDIFQKVEVSPAVNFSKLSNIFVVVK